MINARAQNAYGVAHFAQQNHVPQVRWENVDIIGDFIKNQMAKKQLEMMDKNYELAKDQAAFAREKFGYDQERDKVKDGQWEKTFAFNVSEADKNRQHAFDLEAVRNRNALGQISARNNFYRSAEDREWALMESEYLESANRAKEEIATLQESLKTAPTEEIANKIGQTIQDKMKAFKNTYHISYNIDLNNLRKDPISFRGKVFSRQTNQMGVQTPHLNNGDV